MEQEAGDADHHLPQGAEPAANAGQPTYICTITLGPLTVQAESHAGGVEDLVVVNEEAVEKLTEGLISHYLPQLQTSKRALQELTQNQVILLETLEQEITKFRECNTIIDLNSLVKHLHFVQLIRIELIYIFQSYMHSNKITCLILRDNLRFENGDKQRIIGESKIQGECWIWTL
uniref:Biogenesis of lysosome-related organelles complex 1 subunit 6 n=1 Tax=Pygocentrus nattereri TaxID=42514 RepID=A0AAR2M164_PYGNA